MRVRARTLLPVLTLGATVLGTALAYVLVPHAVDPGVAARLDPGQLSGLIGAIHGLILWSGAIMAVLALAAGRFAGRRVGASVDKVRHAITARSPEGLRGRPSMIAELAILERAAYHVVQELRGRLTRLEQERDEVAAVLDTVGEGILQLDDDGRIIRLNSAVQHLLGLTPDAVGRPYDAVIRSPGVRQALARALRTGSAVPGEIAADERRVYFAAQPLRARLDTAGAEDGAEETGDAGDAGVVVVLVDMTELRRLEAVRRDFVANASHELKTPLTSIRGYAETLLGDEDVPPDVRRDFLHTIHENAARLQRIVDDLLDLGRYESGSWVPEPESVDLRAAAVEAWRSFAERAAERGVAFEVEPGEPRMVRADALALRQILANLFDNALRHTPEGGRIRVRAAFEAEPAPTAPAVAGAPRPALAGTAAAGRGEQGLEQEAPGPWRTGRRVRIEVADTGSGIPRESLGRIFERFYRVDPARSRAEGGTGLGLSIVKHLVENMGGSVGVESVLGRGTTIHFSLPAVPQRAGDAG